MQAISVFDKTAIWSSNAALESLFKFALNTSWDIAIDVDVLGNTVILVDRNDTCETIANDVNGYTHNFRDANTRIANDMEGDLASHHRIVSYKLGGRTIIVRAACDGYFTSTAGLNQKGPEANIVLEGNSNTAKRIHAPGRKYSKSGALFSEVYQTTIGGREVPQSSTFKLKTHSVHTKLHKDNALRNLWITQTPNLIVARHDLGGRFKKSRIRVENWTAKIKQWERENAVVIGLFDQVLEHIVKHANEAQGRPLQVFRTGDGSLDFVV